MKLPIKRYALHRLMPIGDAEIQEHPQGAYVRVEDHAAAVARLERERDEARKHLKAAALWCRNLWWNQDIDCDTEAACTKEKRCISVESRAPEWFRAARAALGEKG